VLHGSRSGLVRILDLSGSFSTPLGGGAPAGDVNGDGYADVLSGGFDPSGGVFDGPHLFVGSRTGLSAVPAISLTPFDSWREAGDVNGDGFGDIILGNSGFSNPEPAEGGAFVFHGAPLTFIVDTTSDAVDASPGDGVCATAGAECSLRAAVMEANALVGSWGRVTIDVPAGTHLLTIAGDGEQMAATGDVDITTSLLLKGAGADCTTGTVITETTSTDLVEGAISVRGGAVEISDLCISGSGRGMTAVGGRLHLHDFALVDNIWAFRTFLTGNAVLRDGLVADNGVSEPFLGGGVFNNGVTHLDRVRIENNASNGPSAQFTYGGVANNDGVLQITNSSISGNTADIGSAIHNLAGLVASNVSIFGNSALDTGTQFGTFHNDAAATAQLANVTIDANTFGTASLTGGAGITVRNSIVTDATGCLAPLTSEGHNRDSGTSCGFTGTGDQQNVAIAFTQDTSGPTTTLVPTSGTNVQDLGGDALCPHVDQRLHYRPPSGGCDIGAAELASAIACANGLDDDGDGDIDLDDAGCTDSSDPQELDLAVGDVLVADSGANLYRLDPATGDVRILSRGLGVLTGFGVAADAHRAYMSETSGRIYEVDFRTGFPSLLTAGDQLVAPRGISVDFDGHLLVAETAGQKILRIDPETGAQTVISSGTFAGPEHVIREARGGPGKLLVSDFANASPQGIYRIDVTTGAVDQACTGGPFGDPRQMVQSEDGDTLWVVDSGPNRVFEIDLTVSLNSCTPVQIGGDMGDAWGVALDANGDLIVASRNEGLFQFADPDTGTQTVINESPDIVRPHEIARIDIAPVIPVPEPGAMVSLASGLALLGWLHRRRERARS
jgi:CSLREA domain-containing protein